MLGLSEQSTTLNFDRCTRRDVWFTSFFSVPFSIATVVNHSDKKVVNPTFMHQSDHKMILPCYIYILQLVKWGKEAVIETDFHLKDSLNFIDLLKHTFSKKYAYILLLFWQKMWNRIKTHFFPHRSKLYTPSTLNIQMKLILLWVWAERAVWAELKLP